MKKKILFLCTILMAMVLYANATSPSAVPAKGEYTTVVEGFDWGPAVNKVILTMDEEISTVEWQNYTVTAERKTDCTDLPAEQAKGSRTVVYAYVSDAKGNRVEKGKYATLVLSVAPNMPLSSPIQYTRNDKCRGNNWVDYQLTITNKSSNKVWNKKAGRIMPLIDRFDLSGKFKYNDELTLSYASYTPKTDSDKMPLIIWLHGGGEGGTDPSIPLIANRAANYASDEIQTYFGGAYVLSPQSPTFWMDDGNGGYARGDKNDRYNEALMALIKTFIANNPKIDTDRIYVGGCSNGGYMTLKLLLRHPDFFAAAFPSALAYYAEFVTDEQIENIKDLPIWFIHSKDDGTTLPDQTVVPVYKRLITAGAKDVHFSYYDHVVDITGFFGGEDYHYPGHWSWIYGHANVANFDYDGKPVTIDGRPVTIMEWLATKKR